MNKWQRLLLIFVLGTTSVLPTLWGDFVFDDGEAIVKNSDVTAPGWDNFVNIFKHDFWGVDITHRLSHKSYRPLTILSYRFDYYVWGHNPFPFHLFDLLIHGLNCVLIYIFLNKCVQSSLSDFPCGKAETLAYWGALVFAVHPVHVEPLGAVVGRADLLGALVFLTGFCCLHNTLSYPGVVLVSIFSVIGALFKETGIALSVLIVAAELGKENFSISKQPRPVILRCLLIITIAASFVLWRLWLQGGPPVFQSYDNPPAFAPTIFSKTVSIIYIWVLNFFLLVNPIWLCYDWSMGCVEIIQSVSDPRFAIVVVFVAVCVRVVYLAFNNRLIMIPTLIFASTFLLSSNLLFTVGFVLAERNLYLPSIGWCLFVAYAFIKLEQKKLLVFLIGIFYLRSLQRSMDWVNQGTLFKSALNVCPNNAKVHYNLGTMYGELNNRSLAEKSYKTAITLRSDYYQAMNNLGNLLRVNDKLMEAETWLRKAVYIKNDFAAAWMNLGIVISTKNQTEALSCYQNALLHRKSYPDCEYNLGNLYLDMGDKERAFEAWKRATTLKPNHSQAWINSVILLEQDGKIEEAKDAALRALKFLQSDDTLHFILGNILGKLSQFESAKSNFEKAISICSNLKKKIPPKYFSNLGVLYHRWGKKNEAIVSYQKALKLDPQLMSTRKNLAMLLRVDKNS